MIKHQNNYLIIDQLERLVLQTHFQNLVKPSNINNFRLKNFQIAIEKIRGLEYELVSADQAHLTGLGPGLVKRIQEILTDGKLNELKTDEKYIKKMRVVEEVTQIPGLGWIRAYELVNEYWIFTDLPFEKILEDLRLHRIHQLPWETQLGIKYFDDLRKKIPTSEVNEIKWHLVNATKTGFRHDSQNAISFEICGSYRRCLPEKTPEAEFKDIDVVWVISNDYFKRVGASEILLSIVQYLGMTGFIIAHISGLKSNSNTYRGYCRASPASPARRIDFIIVPESSRAFALLYFTGSARVNREMRLTALRNGYLLNQTGLFDRTTNTPVNAQFVTERDIFDFLKMPYLEPHERS